MNVTQLSGPGPTQLPPLVNDVKAWDALLGYKKASEQPGLPLQARVQLAKDAGFPLPQNIAQPWTKAIPAEQEQSLAQFNAAIDALARFVMQPGASRIKPNDIVINELFFFPAPQPGYFVRFSAAGVSHSIPVYRR